MRSLPGLVVAGIAVVLAGCSSGQVARYPVTDPYGSLPPGETVAAPEYLGNGELWTVLWPDGRVVFEPGGPGQIRDDGGLVMKFPFWRGEGVRGELRIAGRRLDGMAGPLIAEIPEGYGETGFQATGLVFASEGCWEVTASAGDATLTFVTQAVIAPAPEG
jgi:hypothetical protein